MGEQHQILFLLLYIPGTYIIIIRTTSRGAGGRARSQDRGVLRPLRCRVRHTFSVQVKRSMLRKQIVKYQAPVSYSYLGATPGSFSGVFSLVIRIKYSIKMFFLAEAILFPVYIRYNGRKTRLTENSISPEPNLFWCKLNT